MLYLASPPPPPSSDFANDAAEALLTPLSLPAAAALAALSDCVSSSASWSPSPRVDALRLLGNPVKRGIRDLTSTTRVHRERQNEYKTIVSIDSGGKCACAYVRVERKKERDTFCRIPQCCAVFCDKYALVGGKKEKKRWKC